jgi:ribokinase
LLDATKVERALSNFTPRRGAVFLANLEISDDALMAGARFAVRHGLRLVINPAPARVLPDELLGLRPILLANAGEAGALSGKSDPAVAAARLSRRTGEAVVVTLGRDGALLHEGGATTALPAARVQAVDTTGAGDTFAGAFAAELAGGAAVARAARFAVAAAGLSVTREGARGGMPRRDMVEELLR